MQSGGNIIVDLEPIITCKHEGGGKTKDNLWFKYSILGPKFQSYNVTLIYFLNTIKFPMVIDNHGKYRHEYAENQHRNFKYKLIMSPVSGAGGVQIKKGDLISEIAIYKNTQKSPDRREFYWKVYANNDVIVPTGGCDINNRNISIRMGDYPVDISEKDIDLSVRCAKRVNLKFSLSGRTDSQSIFSNISSNLPASGIGIEIVRNGQAVPVNTEVNMGNVGTAPRQLGLKARYVLNGKTLTTGNVQSVIGVNFTYN